MPLRDCSSLLFSLNGSFKLLQSSASKVLQTCSSN
jgi:hypothetical protein